MPLTGARRSSLRLGHPESWPDSLEFALGCAPRSSPTCTSAAPPARTSPRDPAIRATLLEEIAGADRLVLLGDVLELRELPAGASARGRPAVLRGAGRGDGRAPRSSSSPATTTTASPSRCSTSSALGGGAARPRAPRRARRRGADARSPPGSATAELEHRLPGDLAARRRLRHPRPLHGLPHDPAAAGVRRRGGGDAHRGPLPDPATPGDYERVLRPIYGFAYGLAAGAASAEQGDRPSERAWRSLARATAAAGSAGDSQARARAPASRPASGASTACCAPTSTPTSPPRRSPAAASTPRPSWPRGCGSTAPT